MEQTSALINGLLSLVTDHKGFALLIERFSDQYSTIHIGSCALSGHTFHIALYLLFLVICSFGPFKNNCHVRLAWPEHTYHFIKVNRA